MPDDVFQSRLGRQPFIQKAQILFFKLEHVLTELTSPGRYQHINRIADHGHFIVGMKLVARNHILMPLEADRAVARHIVDGSIRLLTQTSHRGLPETIVNLKVCCARGVRWDEFLAGVDFKEQFFRRGTGTFRYRKDNYPQAIANYRQTNLHSAPNRRSMMVEVEPNSLARAFASIAKVSSTTICQSKSDHTFRISATWLSPKSLPLTASMNSYVTPREP